jgi:hypothetical protein
MPDAIEFIAGEATAPPPGLRDAYHCHVCKGWVLASPILHWVEGHRSNSAEVIRLGCETTCVRCNAVIGWSRWIPVCHTAEGGKTT